MRTLRSPSPDARQLALRRTCSAAAVAAIVLFNAPVALSQTKDAAPSGIAVEQANCTPLNVDPAKINDYRTRDSSAWIQYTYQDNWNSHTGPAVERLRNHDYSQPVMADLAFTLYGWPNHAIALNALIDYAVAGGKQYSYLPPQCYFAHAKRFHNDDVAVHILEGLFYWKLKRVALAKEAYLAALAIDNDSPDAHYNLGLVCLDLKDYDAALEHAQIAYRAGYPLRGLRKKLEALGRWRDEPAAKPTETRTADGR